MLVIVNWIDNADPIYGLHNACLAL